MPATADTQLSPYQTWVCVKSQLGKTEQWRVRKHSRRNCQTLMFLTKHVIEKTYFLPFIQTSQNSKLSTLSLYFFTSQLHQPWQYSSCQSQNDLPLFNPETLFSSYLVDSVQCICQCCSLPIRQTPSHQPLLVLLTPSNSSSNGSSWVPLNCQCTHSSALSPLLFSLYFWSR